jgi:hypothetical protein
MTAWLSRRRSEWFLIAVCALLCAAYYGYFVNRALVEVNIDVDKRTFLRIYWAGEGEDFSAGRNSRVLVSPEQREYRFYLTDIGTVQRLRLDPHDYRGTSTIHRLVIKQKGWQPVTLIGAHAVLQPNGQVAGFSLDANRLVTISSDRDPYFVWQPTLVRGVFGWPAESARILALFLLFYLTGRTARQLYVEKKYIPLFLAAAATLALVMAVVTKPYVHPDEYVHIQAANYYLDHWLPPDVTDQDIRHTYSRYGNSRLNGNEIYYLVAGKFAALTESLPVPDHLRLRLFNVLLFLSLVLVSIRYARSRMVMAVLLISPQFWYVFSSCNSDGFAVAVAVLAGWQVVDANSVLNRFLTNGCDSVHPLQLLVPIVTVGLLFLIKKNYYPLGIFLGAVVCYRIWLNRRSLDARRMLSRLLLICLIGVILPLLKTGLDYAINGLDRDEKIASMRMETAEPLFNPQTELEKRHVYQQMKERGVTLKKIITVHRWFEKTFTSAFGVYGHMTVRATHVYYDLVRWLVLALFVFVAGSVLLRGTWSERVIMIGALFFAAALIGASLHHSWTVDFQAQGRYLFPVALMIGIGAANAESRVGGRLLCLLLTLMFAAAGYSFIGVALLQSSRIA